MKKKKIVFKDFFAGFADRFLEFILVFAVLMAFIGFIHLLANETLVGEETIVNVEVSPPAQTEQREANILYIKYKNAVLRARLVLAEKKLRQAQEKAEFLEKKLTEHAQTVETETEPLVELHSDRAEFRIEPQTNINDFNACYDELIRRGISECGGEPYLGMIAVYQVMYDRMYSMDAGYASLHDMLSVRNAFAAPYEGDISPWEPLISEACKAVFLNGERAFDVPVKYFYNPYYSSPEGLAFMEAQAYVECIGNHIFCTEWRFVEGTNYDGVNPYALSKEET